MGLLPSLEDIALSNSSQRRATSREEPTHGHRGSSRHEERRPSTTSSELLPPAVVHRRRMLHRAATEAIRLATQAPTTRHLGAETGGLGGQNPRRQRCSSPRQGPRKLLTDGRQRVLIDGGSDRRGGGNTKADGGQRTPSGWRRPSRSNSRPLQTEQADGGDRNLIARGTLA